jgi:hypothetical protein
MTALDLIVIAWFVTIGAGLAFFILIAVAAWVDLWRDIFGGKQ